MLNQYYDDWMKTSLESEVIDCIQTDEGYWVACKESVFYVAGGGMDRDKGTINQLEVKEVKWKNDYIYHLVDQPLSGVVCQQIDVANRKMKTQIHSAQHLMCGIMNQQYHAPTISFFHDENEAGAEMGFSNFNDVIMHELEDLCNDYIRQDLPIHIAYPTKEEALKHVALEKTDHDFLRAAVIGNIDYNMCGCIHVPSLRHIQMIKFQRYEKTTRGYRIYFLCGDQLLNTYGTHLSILSKSSKQLAVPLLKVDEGVDNLKNELKQVKQSELKWKNQYISCFVEQLVKDHQEVIIVKEIDFLDIKTFTTMCSILVKNYKKGIFFVCHQEDRAHIVIAHHANLDFSANILFKELSNRFELRGGGSPSMAQGGGVYHEEMLSCLEELASSVK